MLHLLPIILTILLLVQLKSNVVVLKNNINPNVIFFFIIFIWVKLIVRLHSLNIVDKHDNNTRIPISSTLFNCYFTIALLSARILSDDLHSQLKSMTFISLGLLYSHLDKSKFKLYNKCDTHQITITSENAPPTTQYSCR